MRLFCLTFLVCFAFSSLAAAEPAPRPYVLPHSAVIPLKSKINGVEYELYVSVPRDYQNTDKFYPLLLTLDADYQFAVATNQVAILSRHDGQAPEMVVVSVSYAHDPDDVHQYRLNRTRDYTTAFVEKCCYGPEYQKLSGGAPVFAEVIEKEILPFLHARYRIDDENRVLVGHSFGGLFGAWVLLNKPALFSRYILVSPSLWYNDKMLLKAVKTPVKMPGKTGVYMGVGDHENQAPRAAAMVDDLNEFAAALNAWNDPELSIEARTFEDETHASIFPTALSTALRTLFQ